MAQAGKKRVRIPVAALLFSAFVAVAWLVGWANAAGRADGGITPQFPSAPICVLAFLTLWAALLAVTLALFRLLDAKPDKGTLLMSSRRKETPQVSSSASERVPCGVSRPTRRSATSNSASQHAGFDSKFPPPSSARQGRATAFLRRHPFALPLIAIALCWLPYWAAFFPGSLPWDGVRSMNQFITDAALENHHPVLMNALYAGLMSLGRAIRSDNLGLALIVGFQYAVCAVAFALVVRETVQLRAPRWVTWGALAFFCLCPAWGAFAQAAFKDTLFNGVFCLYVVAFSQVIRGAVGAGRVDGRGMKPNVAENSPSETASAGVSRGVWIRFGVASLLLCFVRNNGVYLAVAAAAVLAVWVFVRQRRAFGAANAAAPGVPCIASGLRPTDSRIPQTTTSRVTRSASRAPLQAAAPALAVLVLVAVAWLGATRVLYPACGIDVREDKETLSVPLQQTARYLVESPDDLTQAERDAIDAVIPVDTLATLYNPDLSDPVKESMRNAKGNMTAEERSAYFAAWAAMGVRHPGIYLRATVANTYAYFYPFVIIGQNMDRPVFPLYQQGLPINKTFDVSYVGPQGAREALTNVLNAWLETPVASIIFSPAPYVLAFLLALAYAASRRRAPALVLAVPFAMLLLTVLAGPLNGHLRYVLPLAAALPVLFAHLGDPCIYLNDDKPMHRRVEVPRGQGKQVL